MKVSMIQLAVLGYALGVAAAPSNLRARGKDDDALANADPAALANIDADPAALANIDADPAADTLKAKATKSPKAKATKSPKAKATKSSKATKTKAKAGATKTSGAAPPSNNDDSEALDDAAALLNLRARGKDDDALANIDVDLADIDNIDTDPAADPPKTKATKSPKATKSSKAKKTKAKAGATKTSGAAPPSNNDDSEALGDAAASLNLRARGKDDDALANIDVDLADLDNIDADPAAGTPKAKATKSPKAKAKATKSSKDKKTKAKAGATKTAGASSPSKTDDSGAGDGDSPFGGDEPATPTKGTGGKTTPAPAKGGGSSGGKGGSLPASSGTSVLKAAQTIAAGGTFDGGMVMFDRGVKCTGQAEGGDADAVFILEDGASISNVIIGPNQVEGIHCNGGCTVTNVWWSAVCEDAFTVKVQDAGATTTIKGGGAFGAADKVVQHNGAGTISIIDFVVEEFGKLYRACGNCATSHERHVKMDGITASNGKLLAGVNSNFGDTATITNSKLKGVKEVCAVFKGVAKGSEPTKISSGADGKNCIFGADVVSS